MTWKSRGLALGLLGLASGLVVTGCGGFDAAANQPGPFGGADGEGGPDGNGDGVGAADDADPDSPGPATDGGPGEKPDARARGDAGDSKDAGLPFVPRPRPIDGGDVPGSETMAAPIPQ